MYIKLPELKHKSNENMPAQLVHVERPSSWEMAIWFTEYTTSSNQNIYECKWRGGIHKAIQFGIDII